MDTTARPRTVTQVQDSLLRTLTGWAAASVVVGVALGAVGHRRGNERWVGAGRQTWAWGAVDAGIAVVGRARGPSTDGRRLSQVLAANAVADVGYVAGGLARTRDRGTRWAPGTPRARGEGEAVVVQGLFLFVLDLTQWARLRRDRSR